MDYSLHFNGGTIQFNRVTLNGDFVITVSAVSTANGRFLFGGDASTGSLELYRNNGGQIALYIASVGLFSGTTLLSNDVNVPDTITVTRIGSTITVHVNGILQGTTTNATPLHIIWLGLRTGWANLPIMRLYYFDINDITTPSNSRYYDPNLSRGSGGVLPTRQGGNYGIQQNTWPSDDFEWVARTSAYVPTVQPKSIYRRLRSQRFRPSDLKPIKNAYKILNEFWEAPESTGPVTVTGGAAITFAVNAVGGGKLIKFGGANASFTFTTAGGGATRRNSGSAVTFGVNSAGGGSVLRRGGAVCNFSYSSAGGGVTKRSGGAVLTFTLSMVGGGEVIAGADVITGGAAITFSTGITGGGIVLRRGGAALASFSITSIGGGNVKRRGGSVIPVSVNIVGSGNTKRIGGASVPFTVSTVGAGHTVRNGGDGIEFAVDTAGGGVVNRVGGSVIEFTVTMVGGGENLGQGYTPVITSPVITVSNVFASGDITVDKASVSEPVRVDKTSRSEVIGVGKIKAVPYNLTVQKTFRGQTCIL